jgi:hypothetical protein
MAKYRELQRRVNHNSSQVTKGRRMFVDPLADGRSAWARRWNDLVLMHASDLGGFDMLSEAQRSICKRASAIECELEAMEGRMATSQPIEIAVYARLTGVLARLLELVGIRRLTKPLDPTSELARALKALPATAIDDDEDELLPIEAGLDHEPGEA